MRRGHGSARIYSNRLQIAYETRGVADESGKRTDGPAVPQLVMV